MELQTVIKEFNVLGIRLKLRDLLMSETLDLVVPDIEKNTYGCLELSENQTHILDCGAHVGTFAIWLAKRFPKAKIYAVEPFPINYQNLCHNIALNECENIVPINKALTKDGSPLKMGAVAQNTGGASRHFSFEDSAGVPGITLDKLIDMYVPLGEPISLLKTDIEGDEYEVLETFTQWNRVVDAGIEIHVHPAYPKSLEGWREKITDFQHYLKQKPLQGKFWFPPMYLYDM
jgi:FkbM family methyltransferase